MNVTGSTAVLMGRGICSATINGMRAPWRLQFTMRYEKGDDRWTIAHARYTSC